MNERAVSLLEQLVAEQQKQTSLLEQIASNQILLIQALGEDQGMDEDSQPTTYMDGTRVT
jgi:hypothetical protein